MRNTREHYEDKALATLDAAMDNSSGSLEALRYAVEVAQVYATLAVAADPTTEIRSLTDERPTPPNPNLTRRSRG